MASLDDFAPIGTTVEDDIRARWRSRTFREVFARRAPSEALARQLILHRARHGLTQAALAERLGTTALVIARIERGDHEVADETRWWFVGALAADTAAPR